MSSGPRATCELGAGDAEITMACADTTTGAEAARIVRRRRRNRSERLLGEAPPNRRRTPKSPKWEMLKSDCAILSALRKPDPRSSSTIRCGMSRQAPLRNYARTRWLANSVISRFGLEVRGAAARGQVALQRSRTPPRRVVRPCLRATCDLRGTRQSRAPCRRGQ